MKAILIRKLLVARSKLVVAGIVSLVGIVVFLALVGSKSTGAPQPPPPPEVEVMQVEQKDVPIYSEWIGTLEGMVNAQIKAQVSGYLLTKNYTEGSLVRRGQLLFELDPRPFQAAVNQAKGELARAEGQLAQANGQLLQSHADVAQAEANQVKTQLDENRFTTLVESGVISREQYDNAVQANLAAKAQVKANDARVQSSSAGIAAAKAAVDAAKAALATAQINLGFTRTTSPVDGIAGIAQAQIGDLINSNVPDSEPLTTVSSVDPIKVYFTLSEQEYLGFTKQAPSQSDWEAANKKLEFELILADGTTYPHKGKFFVADRQIDQGTGAIRLAGIFPNPGNVLRPGQYGRVRSVTTLKHGAVVIPQRAVTELQGMYQVAVVENDNKVSIRPVKTGERVEAMWIIEEGLKPGERVIVEGMQRVRPGAVVTPRPFAATDLSAQARRQ